MKERPMIFSGPMVRAILEGRKTQTRRVVKGAWHEADGYLQSDATGEDDGNWYFACRGIPASFVARCPYGKPGDLLWVKETWQTGEFAQNEPRGPVYRATDPDWGTACVGWKWKPSMHMPRWASRITLEITGVRAERLWEISQLDAVSEGCWGDEHDADQPLPSMCFEALWKKLHGARGPKSWDANPWVWVIEFQRVGDGK